MMKPVMETLWTDSYLKWVKEQEQDRNYYQPPVQQLTTARITDAQQMLLLPFEMMRQYMEDVMRQQFEIATGLYFKQAEEFENAFKMHVDKFEVTFSNQLFNTPKYLDDGRNL